MRILLQKNVFDAAIERIEYLFEEFPNIVIGMSGGKDSTVVYELAMRVARRRNRLPMPVFFLDQEAEWTATIDYIRPIMYSPEVRPLWMQMPIHLDNAASFTTKYLKCWDPEEEANWIHPQDAISIKKNVYGTDRFADLFAAIFKKEFPNQKLAVLAGVRCEESPKRLMGLTRNVTYKAITWSSKLEPGQFTFYPLYDWSYTDIWHAIQCEKWSYNRIYDYQYRYGVPVAAMRVSNLHHETAVRSLFHLQEIDPPLYERLTRRLPGVDTAGKLQGDFYASKLPFMFKSWCEYRDYLIEKLTANDPKWRTQLIRQSRELDRLLASSADATDRERAARAVINSILCNDYTGTKVENFRTAFVGKYKQDRRGVMKWTNDCAYRADDPDSFKWYVNRIRLNGVDRDGRRVFYFKRYEYWLEGDVLHRELVNKSALVAAPKKVAACR